MDIVKQIEQRHMKEKLPQFSIGDTVEVHVKLKEGDKERIQIFIGTAIARRGSGTRETFTVRRIVQGEGVERTFPIHSPSVVDVTVRRRGKVRRSKLYYLRKKVGKGVKVKELIVAADPSKKRRRKISSRKAKKIAETTDSGTTEVEAKKADGAKEDSVVENLSTENTAVEE